MSAMTATPGHGQHLRAVSGRDLHRSRSHSLPVMELPFCHMHGPEHHVMVGAALLTAYKNAGGTLDLEKALREMYSRGKAVPAGPAAFGAPAGRGSAPGSFSPLPQRLPLWPGNHGA